MTQTASAKSNVTEMPQTSLIKKMAAQYGLEPTKFKSTLIKTVFPSDKQNVADEQVAAFMVVADQYKLNPFIKEIYAFPGKGGGIIPIVSIDGWNTIINRQPQYDGVEFKDELVDGKLIAVTCRIYRKDRSHPIMVTEYMKECSRNTDPWKQYPARMLRHKALIQSARYAFGFAGIYDPDEAERIIEMQENVTGKFEAVPIAVISEEQRTALVNLAQEVGVVERLGSIVNDAGFEMLAHITVDRLTDVENAIREAAIPDAEEVIDGEAVLEPERPDYVDAEIHEPIADEDLEPVDELESLRANVQAAYDELPKSKQKDVIAGLPSIAKMDKDSLLQLAESLERERRS